MSEVIVASAPGRAGIIGNPTDGYGGSMIACSIAGRARVEIRPSERLVVQYGESEQVLVWENDFQPKKDCFDIVRAVLRYFGLRNLKARISLSTDIPVRAGLAGSTAMLSAVLAAVLRLTGQRVSKHYFAELNRTIELHHMKTHCGYQDAYMTTFGGLNYLDFRAKENYRTLENEVYATVEPLADHVSELPFVVAHTGVQHSSGDFHKPIRDRWLEGEAAVVRGYEEIAQLACEGKRALIEGDWDTLAYLMNENHRMQDSISPSGEANNYLIRMALANGASAAKLAGAGGGGTIIALTLDPERTIRGLRDAGAEEFVQLNPWNHGVTAQTIVVDDDSLRSAAAARE